MDQPQLLTRQDCATIAAKFLNSDDVPTVDFTLVPIQGENFGLIINVYHDRKIQNLNFFVKSTLKVHKINDMLFNDFKRFLPKFNPELVTPQIQHSKSDLQIFEDLTSQDFKNYGSDSGFLNLDHLLITLKVLAKFHAASFAYEELKSRNLQKRFKLDKEYALLHINIVLKQTEVTSLIQSVLDDDEQLPKVLRDLEERQFSSKFRRTLCHGNLVSKNIMFRFENGVPVDCRLLNLKSDFYALPVYDVLQLIFFNTSEDLRQHHLETLLHHYHQCLKEELEKYGFDVEKLLSLEDLEVGAHRVLPLIKLETVLLRKEKSEDKVSVDKSVKELQEILHCPLVSREDCYAIIKNKIGTTNYEFLSFHVTPLNDVSGFLGEYHKLQIKVRYLCEEKSINCFIKCTPKSGIPQEIAQQLGTFPREVFMYEILVTQMQELGIKTINECVTPCYFYRPEEFMVFEDMSLLNYRNMDSLKPLDFTYLSLLIRKLAKFHACSLILEEKMSEKVAKPYRVIDAYRKYFDEPLFFEDEKHVGARQFMTGIKSVLAATELFPEIKTKTNQKNFKKYWPKFKELFYTVIKTSDRFRNVLCHGDLWTSNMLVKLEENKPVDCILLDFQIVRYCPPAYDLLTVLHLTTDRSTRLKHEDELIQIYYDELATVLKSYGYSADSIYPYEDYIGCIKYMKPQMVMQACIDCVLTMCTPEEISSFLTNEEVCKHVYFEDRTEFLTAMCEKSTLYRTRLRECLLDIYEYCDSMCTQ